MPFILSKACLNRNSLNYIHFKNSTHILTDLCQLFITDNIIIVFYKDNDIHIYCKKSFCKQKNNIHDNYMIENMSTPGYIVIDNIYAKYKLNYSRTYKDSRYRTYINYSVVIVNIIEVYLTAHSHK